ncbi:MAG TPA: Uma2 family endonuclease [Candidatus Limnocylindria bacterium]|jgi:Uma2 family endonuclease|nr:Uma2 family endonuclease [Candidatus Limnocylindria bacterium]
MSDMAFEYKLREFTVEEYHRMAEVGVLRDDERVELLDGAIVEMSPIGTRHWDRHAEIVRYLNATLGTRARIVGQGSFPLGRKNEPQPDVGVLAPRSYTGRGAEPDEIYAVVELADSSLRKDTGPKLRLYARFGIPDYLVVDLECDTLTHYDDPHELGYRGERRLTRDDTFVLRRIADVTLSGAPFLSTTR